MTDSFQVLDLKSVYVYLNNTSLYVRRFKTKIALHQLLNVNELFEICASGHLFPPPVHAGASVKVRLPS